MNNIFSIDRPNAGFLEIIDEKGNPKNKLYCIDPGVTRKGNLEQKKLSIAHLANRKRNLEEEKLSIAH